MRLDKLLLSSFLAGLFCATPSMGEVYRVEDLGGGIHDNIPGNRIADNEAVEIVNFHVDPFSHGFLQREGSRRQNTTQLGGSKSVDLFTYVQQDGDEFLLSKASTSWAYSTNDGVSWTTLISTATDGIIHDCATFIDNEFYCVSQADGGFSFNGGSHTVAGAMPSAKFIEPYQNRLFVANTVANPGRLFYSGLLQGTTWTTSTDFTDFPEPITGIGEAFDNGLPIYTENTTWMLRGTNKTNFYVQQISGKIGCANGRTIKNFKIGNDEFQIFLSKGENQSENNLYALDGVKVFPIGNNYLSLLNNINIGNANAQEKIWTDDVDFSVGTIGVGLTIEEYPGDVRFSSGGFMLDEFTDGDYTSQPEWKTFLYPVISAAIPSVTAGKAQIANADTIAAGFYSTFTNVSNGIFVEAIFWSDEAHPTFNIGVSTGPNEIMANGPDSDSLGTGYVFTIKDKDVQIPGSGNGERVELSKVTGGVKTSLNTGVVQDIATETYYTIAIHVSTDGRISGLLNGEGLVGANDSSYTGFQAVTMMGNLNTESARTVKFDNVRNPGLYASFKSEHVPIGIGTATWGTVNISETLGNRGQIVYGLYSDTNTVLDVDNAATFVSSQAMTNGTVPTISFSSYTVFSATFSRTVSDFFSNPKLHSLQLNWNLAVGAGEPDAEVYKGNYWLTHTAGAETRNQTVLVVNRENAPYEMEYGTSSQTGFFGLTVSNGRLFGGDSIDDGTGGGYAWWLENGTLDNGQPVSATVTLKHQEFAGLQMDDYEKSLSFVYFNYGVDAGTFTVSVLENFSESSMTYTVPFSLGNTINRYKLEVNQQTIGRQIGLRFNNDYPGSRLKLYPPITYHFEKVRFIPPQ